MRLFWQRFRWSVVTILGLLYCWLAPRSYYGRRK